MFFFYHMIPTSYSSSSCNCKTRYPPLCCISRLLRSLRLFRVSGNIMAESGKLCLILSSIVIIAFLTISAADPCTLVFTACRSAAAKI